MQLSDLPKEVRDLIEAAQKSGARVEMITLDAEDEKEVLRHRLADKIAAVPDGQPIPVDLKLETLLHTLDYYASGSVKVLLSDSTHTPKEVWAYLQKHGYNDHTLMLLTAAAVWARGASAFLAEGGDFATAALADAYSSIKRWRQATQDVFESIGKNRDGMIKLLVSGGFYEMA